MRRRANNDVQASISYAMIVPRFWAEARVQHREQGRQITVRRFGWSTQNQAEAQAMADTRAAETLRRLLSGEKLERREPKVAYNGAEGVPIREEIVAEHGDCVITRNSYGALCLNTPDVLFADVDFRPELPEKTGCALFAVLILLSILLGVIFQSLVLFFVMVIGGGVLGVWLVPIGYRLSLKLGGGSEKIARRRLARFLTTNSDWKVRLYRTPAGYRVLAMHEIFSPNSPEASNLFRALKCDPIYVKMCQRQQCFRARVSPKPWRIGISGHLRPRPGVWPVRKEVMPGRRAWIDAYHATAAGFAACRFETEMGQGPVNEKVRAVQQLHDQLCGAESDLPIA